MTSRKLLNPPDIRKREKLLADAQWLEPSKKDKEDGFDKIKYGNYRVYNFQKYTPYGKSRRSQINKKIDDFYTEKQIPVKKEDDPILDKGPYPPDD